MPARTAVGQSGCLAAACHGGPAEKAGIRAGDLTLASTTLGWRLVNPAMNPEWTVSLGEATEQLAERHGITRERMDEFAFRSHQLTQQAWDEGFYDDLTVPVPGTELTQDESVRASSTVEKLGGLKTVFRSAEQGGTVTAGNASPLNDGASAALLGSERAAELTGLQPLARIAGRGAAANEPQFFGFAPVEAANLALRRAGRRLSRPPACSARARPPAEEPACAAGRWLPRASRHRV